MNLSTIYAGPVLRTFKLRRSRYDREWQIIQAERVEFHPQHITFLARMGRDHPTYQIVLSVRATDVAELREETED